jgi:cyanophycinase
VADVPLATTAAAWPQPRRTLLLIGGAEDKLGQAVLLRRFLRLAGGRSARIALVPTASSQPQESAARYRDVFTRLRRGVEIDVVHAPTRAAAHDHGLVARLDASTGVFLSGGDQLRLAAAVVDTPVGAAIRRAYERGVVVAGSSAGASIVSRHMISLGQEAVTARRGTSQLTAGLGLLERVVIDQHVEQRGRHGRLLAVVATSPSLLGLGIDEDTAAEIGDEQTLTVLGSGAVFVVDARGAVTGIPDERPGAPLLVSGAVVHSLPPGTVFDLAQVGLWRPADHELAPGG